MDDDLQLAIRLQKEFDEEFAVQTKEVPKKNKQSKKGKTEVNSIVSVDWEITDPNPDIYNLFGVFNNKFFWGKLDSVEVKWSPRMYTCAGITTYKGAAGGCIVSLSLPLLKLRPRKDLIETLLHEMIHAYLFVTRNFKDRSDHGPEFHKHMYRINNEAGTNITVYHDFHDEVRHYKTHWWRCDGPCRERKPFFGLVKRAMNRAPGPNDFWFQEHQVTCGGTFQKIKEPEGFKSRKSKKSNKTEELKSGKRLTDFYEVSPPKGAWDSKRGGKGVQKTKKARTDDTGTHKDLSNYFFKSPSKTEDNIPVKKKVPSGGNLTNVQGFGNSGTSSKTEGKPAGKFKGGALKSNSGGTLLVNPATSKRKEDEEMKEGQKSGGDLVPFSGVGHRLAPPGAIVDKSRSRLLSLFDQKQQSTDEPGPSNLPTELNKTKEEFKMDVKLVEDNLSSSEEEGCSDGLVHCPVCNVQIAHSLMNEHLDTLCANLDSVFENTPSTLVDLTDGDSPDDEMVPDEAARSASVKCPCCDVVCLPHEINAHLDTCLK